MNLLVNNELTWCEQHTNFNVWEWDMGSYVEGSDKDSSNWKKNFIETLRVLQHAERRHMFTILRKNEGIQKKVEKAYWRNGEEQFTEANMRL